MVMQGFREYISISVDGPEDDQSNIQDLKGYAVDDHDENDPLRLSMILVMVMQSFSLQRINHPISLEICTAPLNSITNEDSFCPFWE